jgi:hypothetical protein
MTFSPTLLARHVVTVMDHSFRTMLVGTRRAACAIFGLLAVIAQGGPLSGQLVHPFATVIAATNGRVVFTDDSPPPGSAFYRLALP